MLRSKLYSTAHSLSTKSNQIKNRNARIARRVLSTKPVERTAFEITNMEIYLKHQRMVIPLQLNEDPLFVHTYAGTRVLSLALPDPNEYNRDVFISNSKAVLPSELAQAAIENETRNVGKSHFKNEGKCRNMEGIEGNDRQLGLLYLRYSH